MHKTTSWLVLLAAIFLAACMQSSEGLINSESTKWKFDSYICAFGCDPTIDEVLKPRIGDVLDFEAPKKGFDLLTECNGTLTLQESSSSNLNVLEQLNQTQSPDKKFTAKNTGLNDHTLITAQAICDENGKTSSTFWVVSLNEDTMKVYFEGASFLIFKAISRLSP